MRLLKSKAVRSVAGLLVVTALVLGPLAMTSSAFTCFVCVCDDSGQNCVCAQVPCPKLAQT